MADASSKQHFSQHRSTQADFAGPDTFASVADELLYYKQEYQRLKAIIALQKQKIRKLVAAQNA
ncbi:hypothetical protein DFW101_0665 [Solidesulfovibrio carbinoliphilus subsp. oakridgensis]|uniref:Uncharacterized protein n=1 Tax=Solidesulfovibrio carbinoliphilus subsp. oakridgensis TaxID=694327 RepID=G7QE26_9BACT|nr:hypothetical protein [Solidesulfovibrio carbinoliphilus]EHJ46682.1 hypothetical protein DFW101_0665 [Solidesulfovibrio carbinoliphilus subsp. oakridgensis]